MLSSFVTSHTTCTGLRLRNLFACWPFKPASNSRMFWEVDPAKLAMVYEMVSHSIHSIVNKLTQILLRRHKRTPTWPRSASPTIGQQLRSLSSIWRITINMPFVQAGWSQEMSVTRMQDWLKQPSKGNNPKEHRQCRWRSGGWRGQWRWCGWVNYSLAHYQFGNLYAI